MLFCCCYPVCLKIAIVTFCSVTFCPTFLRYIQYIHDRLLDLERTHRNTPRPLAYNQDSASKQQEAEIISAMNNIYWMAKTNQPNSLVRSINELLGHHVRGCYESMGTYIFLVCPFVRPLHFVNATSLR